jgi:geranyl-CoA carboxylase alpha subunit
MTAVDTILVANRGEIALRIMRTARSLGYRTVAVYSDADAGAPHCLAADSAVRIGGPQPADSYLDIAALLDAARRAGAQAVHPGYGFLAERADFAQACLDAGLVFIGPPPQAIAAMGSKAGAKQLMREAGVPCIPGYDGADQSDDRLAEEAGRIGFPVMVKASAGGGGRGMRRVDAAADLPAALAAARSEALHAFGDAGLILEKAIVSPRHIEIQVFADQHGNVVHMGERDCSVQRRHQKLIEETPSPAVDAALRARMGEVAVAAARAIGYRGAGTLEFLLDAQGDFHFMEMNTRLQVEHAVTEAVLGIDLVEWQLRVAAGEALPLRQEELDARRAAGGHAIEVRLCAEDARRGFLPQSGTVLRWQPPPGIRCDHALADGAVVPPYYDSMLAKIVSHGASRADALRRLRRALGETVLLGVASNRAFLARCVADSEFAAGLATTDFIARRADSLLAPRGVVVPPNVTACQADSGLMPHDYAAATDAGAMAAAQAALPAEMAVRDEPGAWAGSGTPALAACVAAMLFARQQLQPPAQAASPPHAARWPQELQGWSNSVIGSRTWRIVLDGEPCDVPLRQVGARQWDAGGRLLRLLHLDQGRPGAWRVEVDGVPLPLAWVAAQGRLYLMLGDADHAASVAPSAAGKRAASEPQGRIAAPMNGRVAALPAAPGSAVKAGQVVAVIEAMKMEHSLLAPYDGVLEALHVMVGEQAIPGQLLATVAAVAAISAP